MTVRTLIVLTGLFYGTLFPGYALCVQQPVRTLPGDEADARAERNVPQLLAIKLNQAEQWLQTGDVQKARQAVIQARIINQKSAVDRSSEIELLAATVQVSAGQYDRAETTLKILIENSPEDTAARAVALNNLGNVFMAQDRALFALSAYQQALASVQGTQVHLRIKIMLNSAQTLNVLSRYSASRRAVRQAIERLKALQADAGKVPLLLTAAQRLNELPTAKTGDSLKQQRYRLLREAETLSARTGQDNDRASALMALGTVYTDSERFAEALTLSHEALFYAQRANAAPLLVRIHWQLARLHTRLQDKTAALSAYREAIALLKGRSDQLSLFSAGWRSQPIDVLLEEAADAVLQQAARESSPGKTSARLEEVRQIIELTRAESLKRYFRDDCVADLQNRTQGIEQIDTSTLVIYPIALPDRLELLISGSDFITRVRVPVSKQALDHALHNFRMNLQFGSRTLYQYSAEEVYRWLIQPIEPILAARHPETLVFVPNATLQMVPIAALYDGKQYLVERFAIGTTPGLALTDPQAFKRQGLHMVVAGVSDGVQGYTDLPYVEKEVTALADHYPSVLLLNDAFTAPALEAELTKTSFPIVHLASHGAFESDPRTSYILSYDAKMGINAIQSVLTAGRYLDTPVELLTLSACSTAAGDAQSALGLGGLAVKSGARTVLASLWLVSDRATGALMDAFYRQLADPENSRARALQRAQQQILLHPQYRNPVYWSAFVLVGNWQ